MGDMSTPTQWSEDCDGGIIGVEECPENTIGKENNFGVLICCPAPAAAAQAATEESVEVPLPPHYYYRKRT